MRSNEPYRGGQGRSAHDVEMLGRLSLEVVAIGIVLFVVAVVAAAT